MSMQFETSGEFELVWCSKTVTLQ